MATRAMTTRQLFHPRWGYGVVIATLLALAILALGVGLFVSDDDATTGVTVTDTDRGGSASVARGEELVVRIPSNATTGYEWAVADVDPAVLTYLGSAYEEPSTDLVGAGGAQVLRFEAAAPGTTTLALKYWRSWEGDASVADRFEVTVTVLED